MSLGARAFAAAAAAVLCAVPLSAPAAHHDRPAGGTLQALAAATAPPLVFAPGAFEGTPGNRGPLRLDAPAAVAYALGHAPALLAQRATALNLASAFTRARAGQYPSLGGELQNQLAKSANEPGQFAQFGIAPATNFSENTAQLQSTYTLYNGGQQLTAQQARKQAENARYELRRQEEQTAIAVSNGFYALAADRGAVSLVGEVESPASTC